jgi:hypothetical protein
MKSIIVLPMDGSSMEGILSPCMPGKLIMAVPTAIDEMSAVLVVDEVGATQSSGC